MLINKINNDIVESMQIGDPVRRDTLRAVKSNAAQLAKEKHQQEITDEFVLSSVRRELKLYTQTKVSLKGYEDTDLYKKTMYSIGILGQYLPKQLSEEELKIKVKEILAALPPSSDFGTKMRTVMGQLKDSADGKMIQNAVLRFGD